MTPPSELHVLFVDRLIVFVVFMGIFLVAFKGASDYKDAARVALVMISFVATYGLSFLLDTWIPLILCAGAVFIWLLKLLITTAFPPEKDVAKDIRDELDRIRRDR